MTAVLQDAVELVRVSIRYARVFIEVDSPPAPACLTTNRLTGWLAPRSIVSWRVPATLVQNLSVQAAGDGAVDGLRRALGGAHAVLPVAALLSARLTGGGGAVTTARCSWTIEAIDGTPAASTRTACSGRRAPRAGCSAPATVSVVPETVKLSGT